MSPGAKRELDEMTSNGKDIEAVLATHPFHTVYFPAFSQMYPGLTYYGCPRHIKRITSITWAGSLADESIRRMWESHGVFMRIPAGAEFEAPAENNHFSTVFVYHKPSKTIHVDDTIHYFEHPGCVLSCLGKRHGGMEFWNLDVGLHQTPEAPIQFKEWVEALIRDWDFENMCTAHNGNKIGGAKEQVKSTLDASSAKLSQLSNQFAKSAK
jgi:hypothetical protein